MKKIFTLLLVFSCLPVFAQNNGAVKDYLQAESYFNSGMYDAALKSLDQYVENDGDIDKAMNLKKKINETKEVAKKAESLFQSKKYQEALVQYEKLKTLNPVHPNLYSRIGACRKAIEEQKNPTKNNQQKPSENNSSTSTQTKTSTTTQTSTSTSRTPSYTYRKSNPLEPESFTMEIGVIGGTNLGISMDFTASYFLIGLGIDWIMITHEATKTTSLVNSGYTGNFTKETTFSLSSSCTNIFLDLGGYFKYFSVSCQVGLLCGTYVDRTSLYNGSGYGLVDGDLDEYWGSYVSKTLTNSTSDKELHLTLTPQVKGYIPFGRYKDHSIVLGLGYTFIPTLGYNAGLSGNLGIHFRF